MKWQSSKTPCGLVGFTASACATVRWWGQRGNALLVTIDPIVIGEASTHWYRFATTLERMDIGRPPRDSTTSSSGSVHPRTSRAM